MKEKKQKHPVYRILLFLLLLLLALGALLLVLGLRLGNGPFMFIPTQSA